MREFVGISVCGHRGSAAHVFFARQFCSATLQAYLALQQCDVGMYTACVQRYGQLPCGGSELSMCVWGSLTPPFQACI